VLSDHELASLFDVIKRLRESGIGIIYISHRLGEILHIGNRVSVMRQGRVMHTGDVDKITLPRIIQLMVGRRLEEQFAERSNGPRGEVALSVRDLSVTGRLHDISFDVRAGEIVGLAGLIGAGRSELLGALIGSLPLASGEVRLFGEPCSNRSPRDGIRHGFGLVPEERREMALILGRSVQENLCLPVLEQYSRAGFLLSGALAKLTDQFIDKLRIATPSRTQVVRNLSGGNQQKVVLARWLASGVRVLLLDEPTRGVDVGARREIYHLIAELADNGIAILMASSELPEILGMSDRIFVMSEGTVTAELPSSTATQEEILNAAVPHSRVQLERGASVS
jgi:ABC-type sugar transport system ATPase subunit